MDTSPHRSDFVTVNGIRLHYLDWGGEGSVLLFLAGMGCNAHIFDRFAPRFTAHFRVLALTRRGHGESDHPQSGYDVDTLAEDVRGFLDALGIQQAILTGHSMANIELSRFTSLYPQRVRKLVYLDAAYDRTKPGFKDMLATLSAIQPPGLDADFYNEEDYFAALTYALPVLSTIWDDMMQEHTRHEITRTAEGKIVDKMTPEIEAALMEALLGYSPEDAQALVPVLSFYARPDGALAASAAYMTDEQREQILDFYRDKFPTLQDTCIAGFRGQVPHARIVVIPGGHHYCFIAQEELVFEEMLRFLLE